MAANSNNDREQEERFRRWRMILGEDENTLPKLQNEMDLQMDKVLSQVYDPQQKGGMQSSSPKVNRWLGDIRNYFPQSVVQVLQQDAMERLNLHQMLLEPEMLETVVPDVHLVGTLLSLNGVIPDKTKATARMVVEQVVKELMKKLQAPTKEAIRGALSKAIRNSRPRLNEIDWPKTIRKNLKNYLPEHQTIIPEQLVGYGHKRSQLRDVILCVDQSGSMASSVVYSSIFGAVMASIPATKTSFVAFDTEVVDLTELLEDPVDLLFGTQLGGGTDIDQALGYCESLIDRPSNTVMVLITDLYEGGSEDGLLKKANRLVQSGVQLVCLLALSDEGTPYYNEELASSLASLGTPTFACTPELFPDLMANALSKQDIQSWASRNGVATKRGA